MDTPHSPSEFPLTFRGGVWIFSGTAHFDFCVSLLHHYRTVQRADRTIPFCKAEGKAGKAGKAAHPPNHIPSGHIPSSVQRIS